MPKHPNQRTRRSPRTPSKMPYGGGDFKATRHEIPLQLPTPSIGGSLDSRHTTSLNWNSPVPTLTPDTSDCGSFAGCTTPTTPISEASTIVQNAPPRHISFDDHEFEFKQIIQVDGDKCQVSWTDTDHSWAELEYGTLGGKPLRHGLEKCKLTPPELRDHPDRPFRITWKPTWEPVETFDHILHDMSNDPRFETFDLSDDEEGQADGEIRTQFRTCTVHESLLDTAMVDGQLLRELVHSETRLQSSAANYDDNLAGFSNVTWGCVWRDSNTCAALACEEDSRS